MAKVIPTTLVVAALFLPASAGASTVEAPGPHPDDVVETLVHGSSGWVAAMLNGSNYIPSKGHITASLRILRQAQTKAHATPPPKSAAYKLPTFLSVKHLRQVLAALNASARRYLARSRLAAGTIQLKLRVSGASGRVSSASVVGRFQGTAVAECLLPSVQLLQFDRFRQGTQKLLYPIIVKARRP